MHKQYTGVPALPAKRDTPPLRLTCSAIALSSRLSPLEHQPNIGTFASSMADAGGDITPACARTPRDKEASREAQEHAAGNDYVFDVESLHLKNLLNSQKASVKPRLMRREVMSGT